MLEATNKNETLTVYFKIEDGRAYLDSILVWVEAINDWVDFPESFDSKVTKEAERLMMDFMDSYEQTQKDWEGDYKLDLWKDEQ